MIMRPRRSARIFLLASSASAESSDCSVSLSSALARGQKEKKP